MKKYPLELYILIALIVSFGMAAIAASQVIHNSGDKAGDNATQNATPTPTVSAQPSPEENNGDGTVQKTYIVDTLPRATEVPSASFTIEPNPCEKPRQEAKAAGWHLLSCDPLRVMPLEEWKTKSASPNYQYRPELYCFDESNFAGIFKEQMGAEVDGYYPDWLSEMKLDNGCSFFFHPTQGRENAPLDPEDARG